MKFTYKYITILIAIVLLSACNEKSLESGIEPNDLVSKEISLTQSQFNSSNFELGKIKSHNFSKSIDVTGSIHLPTKSMAVVSTLMPGTAGAINLNEGQWVNKGQKLFTITNPELINLQEEYLITDGQLEYLRDEYKRQGQLFSENLTTKKEMLKAKSDLSIANARHGALSIKLDLYGIKRQNLTTNSLVSELKILAPISGYVSQINAIQGMYLDANQTAIEISNLSQIQLKLSVLQKDASLIKKGQEVNFFIQGQPSKVFFAKVHLINKSINENHMISVHCHIDKVGSKELFPGMYTNAKIILEKFSSAALPVEAVVKVDQDWSALTLKERKDSILIFERISVKIGQQEDGFFEVLENDSQQKEFLTKGPYYLLQ